MSDRPSPEDEVYELVQEHMGDPEGFRKGLAAMAERDVVETLAALREVAPPFDYPELARLGRKLSAAATVAAPDEEPAP